MNSINLNGFRSGESEKPQNGNNEKEDQKQAAQRDAFVKLLSKFIRWNKINTDKEADVRISFWNEWKISQLLYLY